MALPFLMVTILSIIVVFHGFLLFIIHDWLINSQKYLLMVYHESVMGDGS